MATIRGATWDDLDDVFALLDARSRAALGTSDVELEHVRTAWTAPAFEIGRDNLVAVDDGTVVGYAAFRAPAELDHVARDDSVAAELLARIAARGRERGADRLEITLLPEYRALRGLVQRSGFELDREVRRMWRRLDGQLPDPAWPDDVSVRTYDAGDAQRVHALLDACYSGWDRAYVARTHDDWLHWMTVHDDFDAALWFLVERNGELVAAAVNWKPHRGDGWVKDIVVRERERGRGLAKALLQHTFREYAQRGAARVGLKVDASNPTGARQLYERVGFETDRRYEIWAMRL